MSNDQEKGVLYLRYDKNTPVGRVIEQLKKERRFNLNSEMINLIFLSEIVELIDNSDICPEALNHFYYESLKLFTHKLAQVEYQIHNLTSLVIHRKNRANKVNSEKLQQVLSNRK